MGFLTTMYLEVMEHKLQDELAQHQNHIISLSTKKSRAPLSAKRSDSKKRVSNLEKENRKLQLRILRLKDEMLQLKSLAKQNPPEASLMMSKNSPVKSKSPMKDLRPEPQEHRNSHSLDRRDLVGGRQSRVPKQPRASQKSVHK